MLSLHAPNEVVYNVLMNNTKHHFSTMAQITVALLMAFLLAATGQAQTSSGTIEGTVADNSGGDIPAALIKLKHKTTGVTRTAQADEQGFFRATDLAIGKYEVTIEEFRAIVIHASNSRQCFSLSSPRRSQTLTLPMGEPIWSATSEWLSPW